VSRIQGSPVDPRHGIARLMAGRRLLRTQWDALMAARVESPVTTLGLLGGWGSAKTTAEVLVALASAAQNPWTEAYGGNRPTTLLITETAKVLRDSLYSALVRVFPENLIIRDRQNPAWDVELANGHVLALRSDAGSIEGLSVVTTIVDEVHKVRNKSDWLNYSARARDSDARKRMVVAAGLPIDNGWLREEFDRPEDPTRKCILMRTVDNTGLTPGYIADLLSRVSDKERRTYLEAEWQTHEGAIYDDFSVSTHVIDDTGDASAIVHLGLDAGHRGAVIVAQARPMTLVDGRPGTRIHVVDELYPDSTTAEAACREFLARGWRVASSQPGRPGTVVCVDPKVSDDQIMGITRAFAERGHRVDVIKRGRGDPAEAVDYGIRAVQAALRDAAGNVRLTFSSRLSRTNERAVLVGLPKYRWDPRTRLPVKDNTTDHALDALRYLVCQLLPPSERTGLVDDPTRLR
jgi:hypothetical protein